MGSILVKFVGVFYLKYFIDIYGLVKFFKWKEMLNRCKVVYVILL